MTDNSKSSRKRFFIQVGISILLILLLINYLSLPIIFDSLKKISLLKWLECFTAGIFLQFLGGIKWRLQLKAVHVELGFTAAIGFHAAGLFANLCMPSVVGGDVLRTGLAIRSTGKKGSVVLGGLIDRLGDVIALCLLAGLGSLFIPDIMNTQGRKILLIVTIILFGSLVSGIGLLFYQPKRWWPKRIRRQAIHLKIALWRFVKNFRLACMGLLLSLCIQSCLILLNAMIGNSIGIEAPLSLWFFAWPLAKLIALIPISFGGLGVQELAIVGLLKPFNLGPSLVAAQSFLWRGLMIATGIFGGLVWLIFKQFDLKSSTIKSMLTGEKT